MKTLEGLQVEALAVEADTHYYWKVWSDGKTLSGLERTINNSSAKKYIDLPEGEWSILGRANELKVSEINSIFETTKTLYPNVLAQEWQSYCEANGLTNELILIKI